MGFLSDLFKPQQRDVTTTQTQSRTPFGQAQPGLSQAFGLLEQGLGQGAFTGDRVAGFNPFQQQALQGIAGQAQAGNPLLPAAQQQALSSIGFQNPSQGGLGQFGQFGLQGAQGLANEASGANIGSNPFLEERFNQGASRLEDAFANATARTAAGASQAGRLRGGGGLTANQFRTQEDILGQNLQELETGIFSPAFEADRNRQVAAQQQLGQLGLSGFGQQGQLGGQAEALRQAATQGAPGTAGFQFSDLDRLFGAGATQQQQDQREIAGQIEGFNDPFNRGAAGLSALGPIAGQFGTTTGTNTTPTFGPSLGSQLLGGAAGLAGAFFGGPMGASIGSSLGSSLGGAFGGGGDALRFGSFGGGS